MNAKRILALAVATVIAGCASGAAVPSSPGSASAGAQTTRHRQKASAKIEIRIPKHHRHSHYVSPNTQSMTIAIDGTSAGMYALTPSSPGCTTVDGSTQCVFTFGVPSGTHTYAISTYASNNGTGTALSIGSLVKSISAGSLGVIPITLGGVVASLNVALGNSGPLAGTAATTPVYITALDASGATIIAPGAYVDASGNPLSIALSNSDTSGITSLSTTSVGAPGAKVTLAYNGKSIFHATIGASATGVTAGSAIFAPVPTVFASYTIPSVVGAGSAATAIAAGPDGNVWYTTICGGGCAGGHSAIVKLMPGGTQTAYVAGATPNITTGANLDGIAAGPDGALWFTENNNKMIGRITTAGITSLLVSTGSLCPNRIIAGPAGDNGLWFTSSCTDSIGHITTGATPTVTSYTLTGGGTNYQGIVLGKDGNLYVVDEGGKAIGQVQIAAGAVTSYSEVAIPANPLDSRANGSLLGIAQTADGQLWFTNDTCSPSTLGNIVINAASFATSTVNQGFTKQGCSYPAFMAPTPDGSVVFEAIWDYPDIEEVVPTTPGANPTLTDYELEATSPNSVYQETWDVAIGPDGNVYATINTNDNSPAPNPANVYELAY